VAAILAFLPSPSLQNVVLGLSIDDSIELAEKLEASRTEFYTPARLAKIIIQNVCFN